MSVRRSTWGALLVVVTLGLALWPAAAAADELLPGLAEQGFSGAIALQPGSIDTHVMLGGGSAGLQATLNDVGLDGQLQLVVPGIFAGSTSVENGALSYQLQACGSGVTVNLGGTRGADVRFSFSDAASDPNRCTAVPAVAQTTYMGEYEPVFAQAAPGQSDNAGQAWLTDWLRRLIGVSLLGGLLLVLIPAMPRAVAAATQTSPWGRLGIGLTLVVMLPILGVFAFALLLPLGLWWLGLLVLALYPFLLVLSLSVSGLAVGSFALARLGRPRVPVLLGFAAGIIVLTIASLLPYVGPVVNVLAVIYGLGVLALAPRTPVAASSDTVTGPAPASDPNPPSLPRSASRPERSSRRTDRSSRQPSVVYDCR